jgi:PPOX class probable FMN-dependent enzyme
VTQAEHEQIEVVESADQLDVLYPPPSDIARRKEIDRLDEHCRDFIARSPFVLLATSSAAGRCDVSPRGGRPGFVRILDDRRLAIPDARGNRRVDSLRNLVDNPHAGLLFLIPGLGETLRANGRVVLTRDPTLRAELATMEKEPQLVIVVEVDEVFLHCAKALRRSSLWEPETWPAPEDLPSAARIFKDHARDTSTVEEMQDLLDDAYRTQLY